VNSLAAPEKAVPAEAGPRFHHVGLVVASIDDCVQNIADTLQAHWTGRVFEDPLQRVKVTFLATRAGETQLELVEPLGADSPVSRFLADNHGGLHHLCFETPDLDQELLRLRQRRCLIVSRPKPAVAFEGRRIAWVLSAEKLLLEFLEAA
jgi:methylmalonyl-CoA/ethylmalonyl-CoA epimerase